MRGPDLAVVVPAFNEAARIAPTLERVLAFLEQREEPFEIVVADDGSSDGTAGVATRYASGEWSSCAWNRTRARGRRCAPGSLPLVRSAS